jgi:ABC-type nitrate/sulfonate/bicarbonate transport system ATPase subunit
MAGDQQPAFQPHSMREATRGGEALKDAPNIAGLRVELPDGTVLLESLSLAVKPTEAVVIVGPSGCGKSTLVRAIFETNAMKEEGFLVGVDSVEVRGGLGLVPQRGAVFDHLDVAGNVRLALRHSDNRDTSEGEIGRWLHAVDLNVEWAESSRSVAHLSGGEAQRLAVARALAGGQRILFLDEPSVGLDPLRVRGLAWQLRRICDDEAVALVVVTHDAQFAAEFADRVLLLKDGALAPLPIADRLNRGCRKDGALDAARRQLESSLLEALAAGASRRDDSNGRSVSQFSSWLKSLPSCRPVRSASPWASAPAAEPSPLAGARAPAR